MSPQLPASLVLDDHGYSYSGPSIIQTPLVTADSSGVPIIKIVQFIINVAQKSLNNLGGSDNSGTTVPTPVS